MSDLAPDRADLIKPGQAGELFHHTTDAVAVIDAHWRIRGWNPAGERLLGWPEDRMVGQPAGALFADADDFSRLRRFVEQTQAPRLGGASETFRTNVRSRAGRLLAVGCRAIRLDEGAAGASQALLIREEGPVAADDVGSARVRQLHQLAEMAASVIGEADLNRVAQSIVDCAKEMLDADFAALVRCTEDDAGTLSITGFTYNAPRHLFPPDVEHPRPVGLLALPVTRRAALRVEDIRGHPDAVGIPVDHPPIGPLLAVPVMADGRVLGELLLANRAGGPVFTEVDETLARHLATLTTAALENARLQGVLEGNAAELEGLIKRRQQLVATIVHDLRSPIGGVRGYAELLVDPSVGEADRPLLQKLLADQVDQLDRLMEDLSMASRADTEAVSLDLTTVDVGDLLTRLADDFGHRHPDREFELEVGRLVPVIADRGRLTQVVINLLSNAVKYASKGKPVRIRAAVEDRSVVISVSDSGEGITAQALPHIFEPFYRSDESRGNRGGMGLGLTIAKRLVEAMSGRIEVLSEPGVGSSFTVRLPAAQAS